MPDVTAEKEIHWLLVSVATIFASVVLPTPGGPQRIKENAAPIQAFCAKLRAVPTSFS